MACHTCPNQPYWSLHRGTTVPSQLAQFCTMPGQFSAGCLHLQLFNLRHFHKSVSNVDNYYGLWRMRYQHVKNKIPQRSACANCHHTTQIMTPHTNPDFCFCFVFCLQEWMRQQGKYAIANNVSNELKCQDFQVIAWFSLSQTTRRNRTKYVSKCQLSLTLLCTLRKTVQWLLKQKPLKCSVIKLYKYDRTLLHSNISYQELQTLTEVAAVQCHPT